MIIGASHSVKSYWLMFQVIFVKARDSTQLLGTAISILSNLKLYSVGIRIANNLTFLTWETSSTSLSSTFQKDLSG